MYLFTFLFMLRFFLYYFYFSFFFFSFLFRSTKQDRKDFELENVEKQVEKYRDVLEKMVRKLPVSGSTVIDNQERDKRIKKQSHYKIGIALEESSKELSKDIPLHHVLVNCGKLKQIN